MISTYRKKFNQEFSQEKYNQIKEYLKQKSGLEPTFRISESPLFLTKDFEAKLIEASESIIDQIKVLPPDVLQKAIPDNCRVPNDTEKPHFFTIDFGICKNENGETEPQLIELQAFPSLYVFQRVFEDAFCDVYPFLSELRNTISPEDFKIISKALLSEKKILKMLCFWKFILKNKKLPLILL